VPEQRDSDGRYKTPASERVQDASIECAEESSRRIRSPAYRDDQLGRVHADVAVAAGLPPVARASSSAACSSAPGSPAKVATVTCGLRAAGYVALTLLAVDTEGEMRVASSSPTSVGLQSVRASRLRSRLNEDGAAWRNKK